MTPSRIDSVDGTTQEVLLVCADDARRAVNARIVANAGFRVREAKSGAEGLAAAPQACVVLLDVELPDLDGFRFCARLRSSEATAALPVILLSPSGVSTERRLEALDAGADACFVHPADPVALVAMVQALVRARLAELGVARFEAEARERHIQARQTISLVRQLTVEIDVIDRSLQVFSKRKVDDPTLVAVNAIARSTTCQRRLIADLLVHDSREPG